MTDRWQKQVADPIPHVLSIPSVYLTTQKLKLPIHCNLEAAYLLIISFNKNTSILTLDIKLFA